MKKGFTLIEILVVVAILGVLMGGFIFKLTDAPDKAKKAVCEDYVKQVATAIGAIDPWTKRLYSGSNSEEGLTETTAYALHKILGCKTKDNKLSGYDRFGLVTPWATETIKKLGSSCSLSSAITASKSSGTIRDHILRYALDDDEDGIVIANVGGETIRIRALVAVWCSGADGIIEPYSKGLNGDDVYSWSTSQVDK